jgi:hypothetical protein
MIYLFLLQLTFDRQTLSAEEQEDLNELRSLFEGLSQSRKSRDGVMQMRAPLHLALLISPIYLLLPMQHFKKSYNRHTMLSISTCLGNLKPQVVLDVEMVIWKSLFSLASGKIDPTDLLQQLSANLPWADIEAAPPHVSHWFNLGKFHHTMGTFR